MSRWLGIESGGLALVVIALFVLILLGAAAVYVGTVLGHLLP